LQPEAFLHQPLQAGLVEQIERQFAVPLDEPSTPEPLNAAEAVCCS